MRFPVTQLTALLLLIHMGFGCCFHHAHACDSGGCELESISAEECETHGHAHASAIGHTDSTELPFDICHHRQHSHPCFGDDCTFVAARTRLVTGIEEANHFISLSTVDSSGSLSTGHCDTLAFGRATERLRPPLRRTHLQLHILQV